VEREWQEREQLQQRIAMLEKQRRELLRKGKDSGSECARKLHQLRGMGPNASWLYSLEFFAWRAFRNRRQIGALAGLTPTPYQSGADRREQGICKAGNRVDASARDRDRLGMAALPARERAEPVVPGVIRPRERATEEDRNRGAGA